MEGSFPSWLKGSLVANGPAVFESGKWKAKHFSDGLARVQRLDVEGGDISYLARLLDTQALSDALGAGESSKPGFATPAKRSFWGRVRDSFVPPVADNANASVVPTKYGLLALGETSAPVEVDRKRLSARGPRPFPEADLEAVHPILEPDGVLLGLSTRLREPAGHVLWRTGADGRSRRVLARLPSAFPSYVHSFSVTPRHAVLVEPPLVLDPTGPRSRPLRERMTWQPSRGTRFVVLGRADGRVRATGHGAPFFVLHHVQAFERGTDVFVDVVAHEDAGVLDAISTGTVGSGQAGG
ncbi:MAG TPA: carotenoid oxygenase family protein, partial [Candidatus Thermoplasmatota archaeon]|nr:carotenoid oxygenase family protein [Candidatus Thermoplasmatota archaeon]